MTSAQTLSSREGDPARLRCPNGHAGWKPINGHFWCPYCERNWDGCDGDFQQVRDVKTGDRLDRTDVRKLEHELRGGEDAGI
jgi:hypothetical protein